MYSIKQKVNLLKKFTDHKKFNELIQKISGDKWIFTENELASIIKNSVNNHNSPVLIKDFLIRNNILSKLYSYSYVNSSTLRVEYISNINRKPKNNKQIISYLESRLKSFQSGFKNYKKKVNLKGIINDYNYFYNNTTIYSLNSININRSVIIASIYDAMLCRKTDNYNLVNLYFDDDSYGKYFIQSGTKSIKLDDIKNMVRELTLALREGKTPGQPQKISPVKKDISHEIGWIEIFDKMQKDPTTFRFRQFILKKINNFLKIESCISPRTFNKYIRQLADVYNSSDMNIPKNTEYSTMINEIYMYLFHRNMDIFNESKRAIFDIIPEKDKFDLFLEKLLRIYISTNFKFLCRFGTQYGSFYFMFAKSYTTVIGTPSENFINSFSKIFSSALNIKQITAA